MTRRSWDLSSLEHASHWAVHVYAAMGFYALTLGGDFGLPIISVAVAAWAASAFVPTSHPLRRSKVWGRLLLLHLVVQVLRFATGETALLLSLEFAASLQWVRLWTRRLPKDDAQISLLAFLHLIAGTVLTTSISFGLVFVVFVFGTPLMLFIIHLGRTIGHLPEGQRQRVKTRSGLLTSRFVSSLALLALPTFLMTSLLFLLFPRVGLGLASIQSTRGQSTTGFGDNVTLGGFGTIRQDPTIVMRVYGRDRTRPLRMRGTSFSQYDGRTWSQPKEARKRLRWVRDKVWVRTPARNAERTRIDVVLEALDQPILFLPPQAVAVQMANRQAITAEAGTDTYRYPPTGLDAIRYQVLLADLAPPMREPTQRLKNALRVPPGHDRIAALAREWTRGLTSDEDKVRAVHDRLKESGEYRYSLDLPDVGTRVPLNVFLFEEKAGHCEYFSSALAVMLRTLGIPTRNVTGFSGGAVNNYGDYEVIRQADAHSWVEAHYGGLWRTLDPTPASRNAMGPAQSWESEIRAILDALREQWGSYVVGYDKEMQFSALRKAAQWWRQAKSSTKRQESKGEPKSDRGQAPPLAWFASAFAILALGWLVVRAFRRRRSRTLLDELDLRWRSNGHPRPEHRTQLEHAKRLHTDGFESRAFLELVSHALALRFGPNPDAAAERAVRDAIRDKKS